jgi:predicted phosphodiesterase
MAPQGVLADIHGNLEALRAALEYLESRDVRSCLCLGDIVGYNADPDACVAEVRDRGMEAVAGNHDLIGIGRLGTGRCSRKAAWALGRTRRRMSPATAAYLSALPTLKSLEGGVVLVHAGVQDVEQYVRTADQVARNAALLAQASPGARLVFFGHTHDARAWELRDGAVLALEARGTISLRDEAIYFVNPGSVDSARKPQPGLAECAVFDPRERTIEFARVPYDHAAAEAKARRAGYRQPAWRLKLRSVLRLR